MSTIFVLVQENVIVQSCVHVEGFWVDCHLGVGMDACKAPHGTKKQKKNNKTIRVDACNMLSLNQTSPWIKELPHHYEDIGGVIERQQP